MKKIIGIVLIITLMASVLTGCGGNSSAGGDTVRVWTSDSGARAIWEPLVDDFNNIVSIIDYKTGNPDLNLNHIIYGLDLQLPVYIYLARKKFKSN